MSMVRKDGRGFLKAGKEKNPKPYINPVSELYKEKLEWLDKYLVLATPRITVKKMISIIAKRYGNSTTTARNTLLVLVNDDDYHFHDGFIHKGGKTKCKYKAVKPNAE